MDPLAQLESNIRCLFARIDALEQEVASLRKVNEDQHQEIIQAHAELSTLQNKYNKLQLAHTLLGGEEDRQKTKNQLTNMISQLDRAIEALKQ
ncbi:MAG: hypothetical protein MJZ75_00645 [Paludibacteraceae bacterium]|nr:hypothetical protein [Paludibacteraceae bacterium]